MVQKKAGKKTPKAHPVGVPKRPLVGAAARSAAAARQSGTGGKDDDVQEEEEDARNVDEHPLQVSYSIDMSFLIPFLYFSVVLGYTCISGRVLSGSI